MCEICLNWPRDDIKMVRGKPLAPNHHPNCPHYNDSLIDVWKVSDGGCSFYTTHETDARSESEGVEDVTVEKVKMHLEVFENLPEFDGF